MIVLRKNATVKVLDVMVPIMAACYFFITLFIIATNAGQLPSVFAHIFTELSASGRWWAAVSVP